MEKDRERFWYGFDENGGIFDENEEDFFIGSREKFKQIEEQLEMQKKNQAKKNLKQLEKNMENNKWEINRMMTSGIFKVNEIKTDFEEDEDNRVILCVHDIKPPFLDGHVVFTTQMEPIQVLIILFIYLFNKI